MLNVKLCAFADEADPSIAGQIQALKENGISNIELRGVDGKNVMDVTVEEMKQYILDHMARHKVPRYIDFVESFPMNAAGKILKYKMRQDFAKKLGLTGDGSDTAGPGK